MSIKYEVVISKCQPTVAIHCIVKGKMLAWFGIHIRRKKLLKSVEDARIRDDNWS